MCDCIAPCFKEPQTPSSRKLSLLLLDCWQREYDKRPYRNFKLDCLNFKQRLGRDYDPVNDFDTIVKFLRNRTVFTIKLVGFRILSHNEDLLLNFAEGLKQCRHIELKLMDLPTELFELLDKNVDDMKIMELSLEGSSLKEKDILFLQSFAMKSSTLKSLNIAACDINQYNFANLAHGIHTSKSITSINISRLMGHYLTLDSDKLAHIISSLIWQNKLQEIIMEKCELISEDMEIIAEYLSGKCSILQKLNMAYNKIGPNGAQHLLKAIARSKTLKYLNLSGCGLGELGGEVISKYLSSCYNLESIILQNNQITAESVNMILLTMKKSLKLKKMYLWGNKYDSRTGDILKRLLDSGVKTQDGVDIAVTYDNDIEGYRVIPWL